MFLNDVRIFLVVVRAYGPKFFQLENSININITHDYLANSENEPCGRARSYLFDVSSCFDIQWSLNCRTVPRLIEMLPEAFLDFDSKKTETRQYS